MPKQAQLDRDFRILIVGAGIAGLTLANALVQRGGKPVVIEVSQTLLPRGLGLILHHLLELPEA